MPNEDKLIPFQNRTHEEMVEIGRKGGINSRKKARERATMKKDLTYLLGRTVKSDMFLEPEQYERLALLHGRKITVQQAIMVSMINNAVNGDVRSAEFIRDTSGQKPTDKVELGMTIEEYVKNHKVKL